MPSIAKHIKMVKYIPFRGKGFDPNRGARQNAAKQSLTEMSEVSEHGDTVAEVTRTIACLSSYSMQGNSDSLGEDRREAVSFKNKQVEVL